MPKKIFRNPEGVATRVAIPRRSTQPLQGCYQPLNAFSQGSRETRQPWAAISERFQR